MKEEAAFRSSGKSSQMWQTKVVTLYAGIEGEARTGEVRGEAVAGPELLVLELETKAIRRLAITEKVRNKTLGTFSWLKANLRTFG